MVQYIKKALFENGFSIKINKIIYNIITLYFSSPVNINSCGFGTFTRHSLFLKHSLVIIYYRSTLFFNNIKIILLVEIKMQAHIIFIYKAVNFTFIKYNTTNILYIQDLIPVSLLKRRLKKGNKVYFTSFNNFKLISYYTFYKKHIGPYLLFYYKTILFTF